MHDITEGTSCSQCEQLEEAPQATCPRITVCAHSDADLGGVVGCRGAEGVECGRSGRPEELKEA
jgi:hypothetical protein